MRKIRAGIVKKLEGAKLTNSELSIFLYLCQYQTDIGTVSGIYCDTPTRVLANWRGFLRHGGTPQRTFTSPLHPVTGLPLSRLLGGFLF